jgi:Fe2+ or Zn2+ uptake regulation protein
MAKTHFYQQTILDICDHKHVTVDEIFIKLQIKYPGAWKATVYRNVEELTKEKLLKKITWVWHKAMFEKNIWNHIHFVDKETWKIYDIASECFSLKNIPKEFDVEEIDVRLVWKLKHSFKSPLTYSITYF